MTRLPIYLKLDSRIAGMPAGIRDQGRPLLAMTQSTLTQVTDGVRLPDVAVAAKCAAKLIDASLDGGLIYGNIEGEPNEPWARPKPGGGWHVLTTDERLVVYGRFVDVMRPVRDVAAERCPSALVGFYDSPLPMGASDASLLAFETGLLAMARAVTCWCPSFKLNVADLADFEVWQARIVCSASQMWATGLPVCPFVTWTVVGSEPTRALTADEWERQLRFLVDIGCVPVVYQGRALPWSALAPLWDVTQRVLAKE